MKNKKLQKQLAKDQARAMHERIGSIILALVTLIGITTVDHQPRNYLKEATVHQGVAFSSNTGRENETTRMPVKYDDVLRWQTVGGS